MREDPDIPWSTGIGIFGWPKPNTSLEAVIGFFYLDAEDLRQDYKQVTQWEVDESVRRSVSTLYLKKTTCGDAWLDFGTRHYLHSHFHHGRNKTGQKYIEPPNQRIAVPMVYGGTNRKLVANRIDACEHFSAIFSFCDENDPEDLTKQLSRLRSATLGAAAGTGPVLLSGLSTLGKLHLTERGRSL